MPTPSKFAIKTARNLLDFIDQWLEKNTELTSNDRIRATAEFCHAIQDQDKATVGNEGQRGNAWFKFTKENEDLVKNPDFIELQSALRTQAGTDAHQALTEAQIAKDKELAEKQQQRYDLEAQQQLQELEQQSIRLAEQLRAEEQAQKELEQQLRPTVMHVTAASRLTYVTKQAQTLAEVIIPLLEQQYGKSELVAALIELQDQPIANPEIRELIETCIATIGGRTAEFKSAIDAAIADQISQSLC